MKRRIKRFLIAFPGFLALCRFLTKHHVRALMYHRFIGHDGLGRRHCDRNVLGWQIEYIHKHHRVISSLDHLDLIVRDRKVSGCPVVFTIDDGYRDFYEEAYPLFRSRNWSATFFATSGLVDGSTWFWWDKLSFVLERAPSQQTTRVLGEIEVKMDLTSISGRLEAWKEASDVLRWMDNQVNLDSIEALARSFAIHLPEEPPEEFVGISWDQALEMQKAGILFGGHTVTHPILARLEVDDARHEILECRERLGEKLGALPVFFCYPQGGPSDFNEAITGLVQDAGFQACYVAYQDVAISRQLFTLPRYSPSSDWDEFRWVMSGAEFLRLKFLALFGNKFAPSMDYWTGQGPPIN